MGLEEFQQSFRCSLYNAIDMVQKASGKRHAFIAVDEVTKVCFDSSDPMTFNYEPFQWLANEVTQHMDVLEGNRVNFVFSSLASIPLIHHEVFWGRKYRVRN